MPEFLVLLAIGLLQQSNAVVNGTDQPVTLLNPQIRRGWEQLCYQCFCVGVLPPLTLPKLVDWLHRPVNEWDGVKQHFNGDEFRGSLLVNGHPDELCFQLGASFINAYDPHLELQDSAFLQVLKICRELQAPDQYTQARAFIVMTPIIEDFYGQVSINLDWRVEVRLQVNHCYEEIPRACIRESGGEQYIYLCPYCSWALQWKRDEAVCHANGSCASVYGNLGEKAERIPYSVGMARTTEGVQRFVVAPEIALMRLHRILSKEWGLHCTLYPQFDAYDLLVEFPNGQRWGVDVKDHRNTIELATKLNSTRFRYEPPWSRAFYVFPDRLADASYLNQFSNYWQPEKDVDFMGERRFLTLVRRELGT